MRYDLQDVVKAVHDVVKENFLEVLRLPDFLEMDVEDVSHIIAQKTEKVIMFQTFYVTDDVCTGVISYE